MIKDAYQKLNIDHNINIIRQSFNPFIGIDEFNVLKNSIINENVFSNIPLGVVARKLGYKIVEIDKKTISDLKKGITPSEITINLHKGKINSDQNLFTVGGTKVYKKIAGNIPDQKTVTYALVGKDNKTKAPFIEAYIKNGRLAIEQGNLTGITSDIEQIQYKTVQNALKEFESKLITKDEIEFTYKKGISTHFDGVKAILEGDLMLNEAFSKSKELSIIKYPYVCTHRIDENSITLYFKNKIPSDDFSQMLPLKYEDELMTDRLNFQIFNETIKGSPELIERWFILCKARVKPEKRSNVTVLVYLDSYYSDLIKKGKNPDVVITEEIKQEGWEEFYKNLEEKYAFNDPEYIVLETSVKKIDGVDVSIKKLYNESENHTSYGYHVEGSMYASLDHYGNSGNSLTLNLNFPSEYLNGFNEKLFRDGIQLVSKNHLVNKIKVYLSSNATGFTNSSEYQKYIKDGLLESQAAFSIKAGQIAKEEGFTATPEIFDITVITGQIQITYRKII